MKKSHPPRQAKIERLLDEIDRLMLAASREDMGMATRILYTAKEDLVHWAVTMRFYESAPDRFVNRRLYGARAPLT